MTQPPAPRVKEAPESALPDLLVNPPWTRAPRSGEPVVLKLKAPKEPTTMTWAPGLREEWLKAPYGEYRFEPLPDDTDWDEVAETFASGEALSLETRRLLKLATGLLMQAPPEYGEKLLADERYWKALGAYPGHSTLQGAVARHGMTAYPAAMYEARNSRAFYALVPFLDADVAQIMIKNFGAWPNGDRAEVWFRTHGRAAARLTVPDALRKPGPKRDRAEAALRLVAEVHGQDAIVEAARHYGEEAVEAIAALRTDPLDLHPDPLPEIPEAFTPERLPQVLLRGRELALPAAATRHLITMLLITEDPDEPYAGLPRVEEALDPDSLAEFAWALYLADRHDRRWASPGVQYAVTNWGNDETADRLADRVIGWSKAYVWDRGGTGALRLFSRLGTDSALRHLHRLATKAEDRARIRPWAQGGLNRAAEARGLTAEQLADRLVPDLGLDADGTLVLDYGPRRFTVGFDEQLKPYVTDENGRHRKTLPKPGVRDDATLAPAAHQRFADLRKEVKEIAADRLGRLEQAMVAGRSWTAGEFRSIFVGHPLLWHLARRLVWAATVDGRTTAFRVAEDRTLADVGDAAFTLPEDARVTLPHPVTLGEDAVRAWTEVFADYEILQPFPQLARPTFALAEEERGAGRLERFEGRTVHFGRILGLTRRGWELGDKETGGFRRQVTRTTPDERHVVVFIEPGIRVVSPDEYAEQRIGHVLLWTGRWSGRQHPFGELDPVTVSEILADLTAALGD
ncbi:DUF4132 domain-containing protein [Thermomonospora amylolytica]|uniref:DUF4132 domain-containing protein n=1 Tax=Thermomonospora amylolytica TaxID=1411117 RepID=UPI000E6BB3D7|nr:DUF4132 domain-containing protein [Thermomonospora amylolytica]